MTALATDRKITYEHLGTDYQAPVYRTTMLQDMLCLVVSRPRCARLAWR
jgi:hypothetical protein